MVMDKAKGGKEAPTVSNAPRTSGGKKTGLSSRQLRTTEEHQQSGGRTSRTSREHRQEELCQHAEDVLMCWEEPIRTAWKDGQDVMEPMIGSTLRMMKAFERAADLAHGDDGLQQLIAHRRTDTAEQQECQESIGMLYHTRTTVATGDLNMALRTTVATGGKWTDLNMRAEGRRRPEHGCEDDRGYRRPEERLCSQRVRGSDQHEDDGQLQGIPSPEGLQLGICKMRSCCNNPNLGTYDDPDSVLLKA